MTAALLVVWASDGRSLKTEGAVQRGHVQNHTAAGLQVGPRRTGEIEDEVDLVPAGAIPLLVGEAFDRAEVGPRREVEEHVDPAELAQGKIDEACALGGIADPARVERHHLATRGVNHLDGLCRRLGDQVAADDRRTLAGERQGGGASHAPARASDDTDLSFKSAGHLSAHLPRRASLPPRRPLDRSASGPR
jgi:hypothetical protein